jgi:hypothetical protein
MAVSVLLSQFQVSSVPITVDTPTRLNLKKRREHITYRTSSNRDTVNIAYVAGSPVTPGNNFFISDRSTSLVQNRVPSSLDLIIETVGSLLLNVDKFRVTDVFTTETPTQPEKPLFFAHTLKNFNSDTPGFADKSLLSIEFADENLVVVPFSEYSLDATVGKVYNNIENTYDSATGTASVRFIKYTVRTISGSDLTVISYHELINNEAVYTQADFDDLDPFGHILPGRKKYFIDEQPGTNKFEITLPSTQRYAYKEITESRIKLLPPTALDNSIPWYTRVTNGRFVTSLQTGPAVFTNHIYGIAEFDAQGFFPFPPYKAQIVQSAIWITETLIKLPKNVITHEGFGLFIEVVVRDSLRNVKFVYTDDPSRVGLFYGNSTVRYTEGILSLDFPGGFVEVTGPLRTDDIITANFYTQEEEYEFTSVDFNPSNNLDILDQRVVVYVAPETPYTGNLDASLHYLLVDSIGRIIYSSQADGGEGLLDPTVQKLLAEDFTVDGQPTHTFYYDKESTSSGIGSRVSGVNPGSIDDFSFIDKYTVESQLLTSASLPTDPFELLNYQENQRLLVLADLYVGENISPGLLTSFDVRVPGGGLKEDKVAEAIEEQPEAVWFLDQNLRKPYPSLGTFKAEVPMSLLSAHGGRFTDDDIRTIIDRHMKIGGYAVIEPYAVNPAIIGGTPGSGTILVSWPSYGSDITYNVYYSTTSEEIGFVTANSSALSDVASGNNFEITGLGAATRHFVKIGATDADDIESFGSIASITTTANT